MQPNKTTIIVNEGTYKIITKKVPLSLNFNPHCCLLNLLPNRSQTHDNILGSNSKPTRSLSLHYQYDSAGHSQHILFEHASVDLAIRSQHKLDVQFFLEYLLQSQR